MSLCTVVLQKQHKINIYVSFYTADIVLFITSGGPPTKTSYAEEPFAVNYLKRGTYSDVKWVKKMEWRGRIRPTCKRDRSGDSWVLACCRLHVNDFARPNCSHVSASFHLGTSLIVPRVLSITDSPFRRKLETAIQSSLVDTNSSQNSSGEQRVLSSYVDVCVFVWILVWSVLRQHEGDGGGCIEEPSVSFNCI